MIMVSVNSFARRGYIYAVGVLMLCAHILGYWALDRSLPTTFLGVKSVTQEGRSVTIVQSVKRTRFCDTEVPLRYIESPLGARIYLHSVSLSRDEMKRLEKDTPGEVRQLINVPKANLAPDGEWSYHVEIEFRCNPLHAMFPIRDRYSFHFPVKP